MSQGSAEQAREVDEIRMRRTIGLVITTGTFTRNARTEATSAPPIDLVDGQALLEKLRELRLGVEVKMIERASAVPEWFQTI